MTKKTPEDRSALGQSRKETAMEKTSRAAREILDEESEQRRKKTEDLRQARLAATSDTEKRKI